MTQIIGSRETALSGMGRRSGGGREGREEKEQR